MKIGIAISTRNRPEAIKQALENWRKFMPKNSTLVVVDDASAQPVPDSDYRFEHNAGIAATKNKCIQLLLEKGCAELFLADDDVWPTSPNWHKPYVYDNVKHMSLTFSQTRTGRPNGNDIAGQIGGLVAYTKPCGLLLYIHKSVIDKIGGFDVDYPLWGMEHVDFSMRAYNAGLTPAPFLDIPNSIQNFHSLDYHHTAKFTVPTAIKQILVNNNRERYNRRKESTEYMPYNHGTNGIILASYFNATPDGQRGTHWNPDITALSPLIHSCQKHGAPLKIFHDCLPVNDDGIFIKVPKQHMFSPNAYRWIVYRDYLTSNPNENVFMVDSTDVELFRNPFQSLNPNRLYSGDEFAMKVDNNWMRTTQEPLFDIPDYRKTIELYGDKTLPNCGIVGGSLEVVTEYLTHRSRYHNKYTKGVLKSTDMAIHNYIVWKHFHDRLSHGLKINTKFKRNEPDNGISYFKHK